MSMQILGIVGWSGSGKTTMLERLLPLLSAAGKKVNVVKHSHHDIQLEPETKDSARLRKAGAAEMLLASPYRYALIRELRGQQEPPLAELLARMNPADLTLVEGYKWEPIIKLEIHRPSVGKPALYLDDPDIRAVASDVPAPPDLRQGLVWLDLNQPEELLSWLINSLAANIFQKS
ncbi:molybdopterin-guanine dinucleotide biosynthesis protein B [Undibacterium terreum]|uniref:Molybdopterin-guanine dinucleotide biosynthesis protein MobB n=1 Tax=Undibacterium terreum TaxID=1224302 RepID=A0A916UUC9_9BURK|nr:molybdopterin-guanine dinucleotide biosynthesis protein B [Undibacterium terreum]GGC85446.1 molybdopterin-guanine dinucleotide biosynthesis protein MobB [Undibacterium terreum]